MEQTNAQARAEFDYLLTRLRLAMLVEFNHHDGAGLGDYHVQRAVGRALTLLGVAEIRVDMSEQENLEGYFRYDDSWQPIVWARTPEFWARQGVTDLIKALEPALSLAAQDATADGRERRRRVYGGFPDSVRVACEDDDESYGDGMDFGVTFRLAPTGDRIDLNLLERATPDGVSTAPAP